MPHAVPPPSTQLEAVISMPRFRQYLLITGGDAVRAADLYGWNARVSAALMLPMHFAEIAARNVVDAALTDVYGSEWPWSEAFERSLPRSGRRYNPQRDLTENARRYGGGQTGKVVADLKFVFWQMMFTASHHPRVWDQRLGNLLPGSSITGPTGEQDLRERIYNDLEAIRKVRNRVAHHEPIHNRPDLAAEFGRMLDLIDLRCAATGKWVRGMEEVSALLSTKPRPAVR